MSEIKTIDYASLKKAFEFGAKFIAKKEDYINELNVFPVPDGDTGTNLKVTTTGAFDTIVNLPSTDLLEISKTFARGLLMNAKGNSGVIFSQIFKGFSVGFKEKQVSCDAKELIQCFKFGKEWAYKAVTNPIEGTILSVIRVVAEQLEAQQAKLKSINDVLKCAYDQAEIILAKTPSILPQLKQAGVVDSGGYGLTRFLEGMYLSLDKASETKEKQEEKQIEEKPVKKHSNILNSDFADNNVGFGYCCEFIMQLGTRVSIKQSKKEEYSEESFKKTIKNMGNSFVYVRDEDLVKVHVHVLEPYKLLEYASRFGEFNKIKIDNMSLQFILLHPNSVLSNLNNKKEKAVQLKNGVKFACVVPSKNLANYFKTNFNVNNIINSEEVGNPSIQDFYDLIKSPSTKQVILLTDNSNAIMAAKEAINLVDKDIKTYLIPCKDIMQNLMCVSIYSKKFSLAKNVKYMHEILKTSITGKIAVSSKDVVAKKVVVKKGDFMSCIGSDIISSSTSIDFAITRLIDKLFKYVKKPRKIFIIYGKEFGLTNLRNLQKYIEEEYGIEQEVIFGNQSIYQLYIGLLR